ncbi:flagellar protein FlaG [Paenibacillus rhizophilus]|uniref:Flagellar protein FlaG n=1 Tax=Paenibacillus rhizophilus TaxID=1850366 RepID=A0A3N9PUI0_9BACL|nr:flagellar protein FlaG [Paenibacillus rhizophilus]
MDVRLSNTGGYKNSIPDYRIKPSFKSSEADTLSIESVHTTGQLKKLESQGVTVSPGEEQTVKALEKLLKALEGPETTFEVSIHKETKAIMVKVLNKDTGELIREIPPEKTLDIVANMMEIAGIIVDERV